MATQDSGTKLPSRYFSFRWAYVLLALILWAFFLPLIWVEADHSTFWTPAFLFFNLLAKADLGTSWLQLHGVFGFTLYDGWYGSSGFGSYWVDPMLVAATVTTLLLIGSVLAFVTPEKGRAKNLPATRGIHLRGKFATSLVLGMAMTALLAGCLDLLQIDLTPTFDQLGWMSTPQSWGWGSLHWGNPPLSYYPSNGFAMHISWISTLAGTFIFGTCIWLLITFVRPGLDRYWHTERWTLTFTLFGLTLSVIGLFGMRDQSYVYDELELFLGGCYTTFIIGLFTLVWAWTCRTILFMMMRRYEKAAIDSDEPTCFACGYDLRMLASDSCPECGTAVHPEVLIKIREASAA